MSRLHRTFIIAFVACSGLLSPVSASAPALSAGVRQAVTDYLRAQTAGLPGSVSYEIGTLDSRASLPACDVLHAFSPPGSRLWGITRVGVRCTAPTPWTIYVPVTVRVTGHYVVTARPLAAGHLISAPDIALQHGDLTGLPHGIVTDPAAAAGRVLAAPLAGGQPLRQDMLRAQIAVLQGQTVKLISSGPGFSVSAEGRAVTQAAEGQVAQVRGPSGQTVSGIARRGGIVEVRY